MALNSAIVCRRPALRLSEGQISGREATTSSECRLYPFITTHLGWVVGCKNRPVVSLMKSALVGALDGMDGYDVPEQGIPSSREHHLTDACGQLPGYCDPRNTKKGMMWPEVTYFITVIAKNHCSHKTRSEESWTASFEVIQACGTSTIAFAVVRKIKKR